VTDTLVWAYLGGWAVAAVVLLVASRRLRDERRPAPHPLLVSVVGGAVWPLLLLGAVELGSAAAASKIASDDEPGIAVLA
jgi:hypothetical protein